MLKIRTINIWHCIWNYYTKQRKDMYSIILTGYIPFQKVKEFKQHMKQIAGRPENEHFLLNVFQDILHDDLFRVKLTFNDKQDMFLYMRSENYSLISGSFKALGLLLDQRIETSSDVKEKTEGAGNIS